MVERDGLSAFVSWAESECELGKGKRRGYPEGQKRQRPDRAERMERKSGETRPPRHRQRQQKEGRRRRGEELESQGPGPVRLAPSSPHWLRPVPRSTSFSLLLLFPILQNRLNSEATTTHHSTLHVPFPLQGRVNPFPLSPAF